jgi:hypothetical protein
MTREEKLTKLSALTNKSVESVLSETDGMNTDPAVIKIIVDLTIEEAKKVYDIYLSDQDLEDLITFQESELGQKQIEVSREMIKLSKSEGFIKKLEERIKKLAELPSSTT